jgi:hypothetical protein
MTKWLVVQDDDGSSASFALDGVEEVTCDGKGEIHIHRRGFPPKGFRPRSANVADEPYVGASSQRHVRSA